MIELKRFNVHRIVDTKEKAEELISLGFSIVSDNYEKDNNDDLSDKTVSELKEIAKTKEINGYSSMKKEELLEVLKSEC